MRLLKVSLDELKFLQIVGPHYALSLKKGPFDEYMLTDDIAWRMWKTFRTKIESGRKAQTFNLKISEAVILLRACRWPGNDRGDYEKFVAKKYKGIIDQQLKSINIVVEPEPEEEFNNPLYLNL